MITKLCSFCRSEGPVIYRCAIHLLSVGNISRHNSNLTLLFQHKSCNQQRHCGAHSSFKHPTADLPICQGTRCVGMSSIRYSSASLNLFFPYYYYYYYYYLFFFIFQTVARLPLIIFSNICL